jgi:hypothetical protein
LLILGVLYITTLFHTIVSNSDRRTQIKDFEEQSVEVSIYTKETEYTRRLEKITDY